MGGTLRELDGLGCASGVDVRVNYIEFAGTSGLQIPPTSTPYPALRCIQCVLTYLRTLAWYFNAKFAA